MESHLELELELEYCDPICSSIIGSVVSLLNQGPYFGHFRWGYHRTTLGLCDPTHIRM